MSSVEKFTSLHRGITLILLNMKFTKSVVATTVLLLFCFVGFAQKEFTKEADASFKSGAYFAAIPLYKKAYIKETKTAIKGQILFNIAECYRQIQDPVQAEVWFQKAIKFGHPDPKATLYLADVIKAQGRYDEAIVEYNKYKAKEPGDSRGADGVKSCELSVQWEKDQTSTKFKVENEVLLNSKEYDFSPTWADKNYKSLIFTSTREGSAGKDPDGITGENFSDLFESKRDKRGKWGVPTPVQGAVNSPGNEGSASFNKRKNQIYFTRCESAEKKVLVCNIYTAKKQGKAYAEPTRLEFVHDSVNCGHPYVSKDDQYLFFASDMLGGQGGKDIFYSKYIKKEKKWSEPVNLGPEVNTPGNEMFPYLKDDGTLYFSSDGHLGMGGLDIFSAEKLGEEKWGKVENMKSPINSAANDFGIIFEGNKNRGFLTSNRKDTKGGDDIYHFYMPPTIFIIQGVVTDVDDKTPLKSAKVKLIGTDGSSVETETDELGFYIFDKIEGTSDRYIQENTAYTMVVSKDADPADVNSKGYLQSKGQETTIGVPKSTTFVHDFALQCANCGEISFKTVLYELGKWDLMVNETVNSKDSLNDLYQTLIDNPTIVIELSAHTDSRGGNQANLTLSQKRAVSCVEYLVSKGIDPARLQPKGYGEEDLKVTDEVINSLPTLEEREAAHQQNRRTVFKVLSTDYVPKPKEEAPAPDGGGETPGGTGDTEGGGL